MNFNFERVASAGHIEFLEPGISIEHIGIRKAADFLKEQDDECAFIYGVESVNEIWRSPDGLDGIAGCAEYLFEQLTGMHLDLEAFRRETKKLGIVDLDEGISLPRLSLVFQSLGINYDAVEQLSLSELMEHLTEGRIILCLINERLLSNINDRNNQYLMPDGIIQLTSVNLSKPDEVVVHYISFTTPPKINLQCSYNTFVSAWDTSNRFGISFEPLLQLR